MESWSLYWNRSLLPGHSVYVFTYVQLYHTQYKLSGRDIFLTKHIDHFTRISVCESKMNFVACARSTFQIWLYKTKIPMYFWTSSLAFASGYLIQLCHTLQEFNLTAFEILEWMSNHTHWFIRIQFLILKFCAHLARCAFYICRYHCYQHNCPVFMLLVVISFSIFKLSDFK